MQIHGKRKRKREPSSSSSSPPSGARSSGPGRPLKPQSELKSRQAAGKRNAQYDVWLAHQGRATHAEGNTLAALERLPNEIIQTIFFFALEVNLPRASPHLSEVLSTDAIYKSLILLAYFEPHPDRKLYIVGTKRPEPSHIDLLVSFKQTQYVESTLFLPAQYQYLDRSERLNLQGGILSCRWCDHNRIRSCLPILARLRMVDAWYEERSSELSQVWHHAEEIREGLTPGKFFHDVGSAEYEAFNRDTNKRAENPDWMSFMALPQLDNLEDIERHYLVKHRFLRWWSDDIGPEDFEPCAEYLPRILLWRRWENKDNAVSGKAPQRARSTLNVLYIPDYLVDGTSWTQQNIAFLRLLRQGFRFPTPDDSRPDLKVSADAIFRGMEKVVLENNVEILKILVELHQAVFLLLPDVYSYFESGYSFKTSPAIPLGIFHLATEQSSSSDLIELLIRASIDSIPINDTVLTSWALRDNGEVARWLLKHMERPRHEYGLYEVGEGDGPNPYASHTQYLFEDGGLQDRWRSYPFPSTSFAEELRYDDEWSEAR